jgi:hypothetical protein
MAAPAKRKRKMSADMAEPTNVISIFKSTVEEVGGVIDRHTKMLKGAKKQVRRSLPQNTVCEV